jgi:hypothetical protein
MSVANKMHDEFVADMLPLLNRMERAMGPQILLQMRSLASPDGTNDDPAQWLPHTIYHKFFRFYITHDCHDGSFHLARSSTSELLVKFINERGEVKVPAPSDVRRHAFNTAELDALTRLCGEHVKDANATDSALKDEKQQAYFDKVEDITRAHMEKHGWQMTPEHPAFTALLEHKNDKVSRLLNIDRGRLRRPHCAFLYALRNAWHHPHGRAEDVTSKIILRCVPPQVRVLIQQLSAISPGR